MLGANERENIHDIAVHVHHQGIDKEITNNYEQGN